MKISKALNLLAPNRGGIDLNGLLKGRKRTLGTAPQRLLCNFSLSTREKSNSNRHMRSQANWVSRIRNPKDIVKSGMAGPILGHVGDSNFHAVLLVDPENHQN